MKIFARFALLFSLLGCFSSADNFASSSMTSPISYSDDSSHLQENTAKTIDPMDFKSRTKDTLFTMARLCLMTAVSIGALYVCVKLMMNYGERDLAAIFATRRTDRY